MAKQGNCIKFLIMLSLNVPHVLFMMHFTFYIVWLYLSLWELLPCEALALAAGGSKSFFMCAWSLLSKWSLCQVILLTPWDSTAPPLLTRWKSHLNTGTMCGHICFVYLQVFLLKRKLLLSVLLYQYCGDYVPTVIS